LHKGRSRKSADQVSTRLVETSFAAAGHSVLQHCVGFTSLATVHDTCSQPASFSLNLQVSEYSEIIETMNVLLISQLLIRKNHWPSLSEMDANQNVDRLDWS
jgi:hypothetical protein